MKFIMKHGKTEKDIHNLRQEIEVSFDVSNKCMVFLVTFAHANVVYYYYYYFFFVIWDLTYLLQILRKLKHENIIEMIDSFESQQEFCVVTEFAQVMISFPYMMCTTD